MQVPVLQAVEEGTVVVQMEMNEVVDGFLYLGSARSAVEVNGLRQRGITHVLTVTDILPLRAQVAFGPHNHLHINIIDFPGEQLLRHLPAALGFIEKAREAGGKVLVHCSAGVSRSASVVLAYLMRAHKLTLKQAFIHVKLRRPCIRPNGGFLEQLAAYEREVHGSASLTEFELKNITEVYRKEWQGDGKPQPLPEPTLPSTQDATKESEVIVTIKG